MSNMRVGNSRLCQIWEWGIQDSVKYGVGEFRTMSNMGVGNSRLCHIWEWGIQDSVKYGSGEFWTLFNMGVGNSGLCLMLGEIKWSKTGIHLRL